MVTTKDSSTQTGESQILLPTFVIESANSISSIDNRCSLSKPTSAGYSGEAPQKPASFTTTKSVTANISNRVERTTRSPQKGNQKLRDHRMPKGANNSVDFHNRLGALEDMDFAPSPSSARVRRLSPKKQKLLCSN